MLHALLRRDRAVVLGGLVAVIMLAWGYLLLGAGIAMDEMDMGGGQIMMMAPPWTFGYAALVFIMWAIMMVAMMLPSAAPTILLVAALGRDRIAPVAAPFACGYVLVWTGFSLAATAFQFGLDRAGVLSETMATSSAAFAGIVLIVAGAYQWTPLKQACLRHCRSPLRSC
jgi:predicted metal-binding membrane protein